MSLHREPAPFRMATRPDWWRCRCRCGWTSGPHPGMAASLREYVRHTDQTDITEETPLMADPVQEQRAELRTWLDQVYQLHRRLAAAAGPETDTRTYWGNHLTAEVSGVALLLLDGASEHAIERAHHELGTIL